MYRLKEINEALRGVCGWEQSYNPSNAIESELTRTESGLTYQGAHPLLTLENMRSIMPDDWDLQYNDWGVILSYQKGDKVKHSGIIWIAKKDNVGEEPTATDFNNDYSREDHGNPYWKPFNPLSDYLDRIESNGINTAIQTFIQQKQLDKEFRTLLEHRTFFDGAGRIKATLMNTHKLVGFEIVPVRSMGVTTKIERIGLQMTGAVGKVRMYLFHSSQTDPIKTFDLDFTVKNGGFQWFNLTDCYLPYISDGINSGGSWFLCYNQDELPQGMEAINVSKDWSREPCGTCNIGSVETWREITKYMQVTPFMVGASETFEDYPELWDIAETMYTNTQNYGLNCEVSVGCDLTDFIISQRNMFASVIQKQVASMALRTMAMNPSVRVNRNQSNVNRSDVLFELVGNTDSKHQTGIDYELKQAYKALNFDTKGIDRICLTCNNHGVKYRTV